MENESDIIDGLAALGYDGKCTQNNILEEALTGGPKSENFRELVAWLTYELHILRKTEEKVDRDSDEQSFAMELSVMLKELCCPYTEFVAGPLSGKFKTKRSLILLLDFLISELMTSKMCMKMFPEKDTFVIPKFETDTARALLVLTKELNLGKPPDNVAPKAMFDKIVFRLEETIRNTDKRLVSEPLLTMNKPLSDEQWAKLEKIQKDLDAEYNMRREMLITRLEVTIQSFQWGDQSKKHEEEIVKQFQSKMKELERYKCGGPDTDILALLSSRKDLAIIEKMSNANVRMNTSTSLQKHVIGVVPDRGGRANEHAPPPPEMPSWQQQRTAGPGGRGGGFHRGGRGGGGGGGGNWRQPNQGGGGGGFNNQPQGGGDLPKPQYLDQRGRNPIGGGQRQQFDNQRQYSGNENRGGQGSGRIQGGWSQRGSFNQGNQSRPNNYRSDDDNSEMSQQHRRGSRDSDGSGGFHRGGGGGYRGKSNYNSGGGGGGGNRGNNNYQRR